MGLINQKNVYRGVIADAGFSQSTNGFPQEVLSLRADEVYDPETDTWLPADPEANEITWYGVLIDSKDKETKNAQQLKKITGWSGASFVDLSQMNLVDVPIQFRVEPNTYKENTTLQVSWIDTTDAPPFRTVQKLDAADVAALQSRYASVLASTKSAAKPVSAVSAPKTVAKPVTKPVTKPKAAPKVTKPTAPKPTPTAPKTIVGKCNADEAYTACYNLKRDDVTDDALNGIWLVEVAKVNADESKITDEQWFVIKESVLGQVSKV